LKTEEKIKKEFNKREKRIYEKLNEEKKLSYLYKKVLSKLITQKSDKYNNIQIVKDENIESKKGIKHTPEYYRLLKLKRTFLKKKTNAMVRLRQMISF
jgi:acetyl/propionyl-CoA carboxylase alpha subunit